MSKKIFGTIDLQDQTVAVVVEAKGKHLFSALKNCKGDTSQLFKYLIIELVEINGKPITESALNEMDFNDVGEIINAINVMTNKFNF